MARSRTAKLGPLAIACVALGMAACGFTGLGTAPPGNDGGVPSNDGAAGDSRGPFAEGGEIVVGGSDGGGDAALDAADAAVDAAPFTCPSVCSRCTGSTCNIVCSAASPCVGDVVCPMGIPCHIMCSSSDACSLRNLSCATASSCRIECSVAHACQNTAVACGKGTCRVECNAPADADACNIMSIDAMMSAGLCLQCRGQSGNPGCTLTDTKKPMAGKPCNTSCSGGGCNALGSGFNGCGSVGTCP